MKCCMIVLLGLAAITAARPDFSLGFSREDFSREDFSREDSHQVQVISRDNVITGSYSWTSPEGVKFFVKYIADKDGYRILESNAVPATVGGVRADGTQGSFVSSEEDRK
ncbi:uncharacterized protein [Cherax quadricarinatus]|uniref:uncharacterized protein n=1 Tax=Cherax quadricarinatus TaxID=27406 RepID=UPI00387E44B6